MCGVYTCVCLSSKYAYEQTTGKNTSLDFFVLLRAILLVL